MTEKIVFILLNTDPRSGSALGSILSQAIVAAAMDYHVELIFTGQCEILGKKDFANTVVLEEGNSKVVYDLIREAYNEGVVFKISPNPLEQWHDELIPEIHSTVGNAYIISEVMDGNAVSLTY